jgi:SAM-dependent methyltransferase
LIYAAPQEANLDAFNYHIFEGDPGAPARLKGRPLSREDVWLEEGRTEWALDFVRRFIQVENKTILDLRCQSGALSAALRREGARVYSADPFAANLEYAREIRRLSNVYRVPFSRFDDLPIFSNLQFDAITALSDHVLMHVVSPRQFLSKSFEILKPGGYLFLAEKDVLQPSWSTNYRMHFPLDSGRAHQYHTTFHTVARYLTSVGFDLVEYEMDDDRFSNMRQFRAVARKPQGQSAFANITRGHGGKARVSSIVWHLRALKLKLYLYRSCLAVQSAASRLARKSVN